MRSMSAARRGRLSLPSFFGEAKKEGSRRATPGIGDGAADNVAVRLLQIIRRNTLRYSALRAFAASRD
jgi:hypothetical protein